MCFASVQVKESLGKGSACYRDFSTALVQYKKTEDLDAVCSALTNIFLTRSHNPQLFASKSEAWLKHGYMLVIKQFNLDFVFCFALLFYQETKHQ